MVVTEYCTSRTEPDLLRSSYLQTIGKHLDKNIDFLWTGNSPLFAARTSHKGSSAPCLRSPAVDQERSGPEGDVPWLDRCVDFSSLL